MYPSGRIGVVRRGKHYKDFNLKSDTSFVAIVYCDDHCIVSHHLYSGIESLASFLIWPLNLERPLLAMLQNRMSLFRKSSDFMKLIGIHSVK